MTLSPQGKIRKWLDDAYLWEEQCRKNGTAEGGIRGKMPEMTTRITSRE
jgi:hypothetical protein